jgi:hypothetical protein
MKKLLIGAAALSLLTACATPTSYMAAPGPRAVGFSDYRIETGRYRITFRGGPGAPPDQVANYALLRAAEVSLRDGYDWFRIVDKFDERTDNGGGPRLSVGTGGASFGRRSVVGVGIGTSFDLSGGPAFSRTLEVQAGKGDKPSDGYDARDIVRVVGRGEAPAVS